MLANPSKYKMHGSFINRDSYIYEYDESFLLCIYVGIIKKEVDCRKSIKSKLVLLVVAARSIFHWVQAVQSWTQAWVAPGAVAPMLLSTEADWCLLVPEAACWAVPWAAKMSVSSASTVPFTV